MNINWIDLPTISDPRGNIAVLEKETLPFVMQRVYYLFDVPSTSRRGGHAHRQQMEVLVALSGSFEVILDNGVEKKSVLLNKPNRGLLIPEYTWRELENFSSGAVCLVVSSGVFDEEDYIRDYPLFLKELFDLGNS